METEKADFVTILAITDEHDTSYEVIVPDDSGRIVVDIVEFNLTNYLGDWANGEREDLRDCIERMAPYGWLPGVEYSIKQLEEELDRRDADDREMSEWQEKNKEEMLENARKLLREAGELP